MLSIAKSAIKTLQRHCHAHLSIAKLSDLSNPIEELNYNKKVTFRFLEEKTGEVIEVKALPGVSVLEVAKENNVDMEGACGGQMACSTCHVVLDKKLFDELPAKVEAEDDMLDLAWGLTDTSRLCCQIKVSELLEGQTIKVPADANNLF